MSDNKPEGLALLRVEFPPHQISKLPKPTKAQTDAVKQDFKKGIRCTICGAWHAPDVVHLDYVGHAALTDRLLDADPAWSWEPLALSPEGLPVLDGYGGMWIRLTVCGVTRLGYGHPDGKEGGNAIKEVIGDALRNAAMRFGAALDLWHKGELHKDEDASQQSGGGTPAANQRYAHTKGNERGATTAERVANEIIEAIRADLTLTVVERYGAACEDGDLADQVWTRLSSSDRAYVTDALNKAQQKAA